MKAEVEKKIDGFNRSKSPLVVIDPLLDKYQGKVLFPGKLAIAEKKIKGLKLSQISHQGS